MRDLAFFYFRKNFYLNDNGKFNLSINFKINCRIYFVLLNFSNPIHLSKIIEQIENTDIQIVIDLNIYQNNLINTYEEENPYFNKSGLLQYLIFIFGKEYFFRVLNELMDFTNYINSTINLEKISSLIEEKVKFKFTQQDNNSEILAIIEFGNREEIEIDRGILLDCSGLDNMSDALQYYIDKVNIVINEKKEFKMIIRDDIIFQSYFHISSDISEYFGFVDNEHIEKPDYIGKVRTINFIKFLISFKELVKPYVPHIV